MNCKQIKSLLAVVLAATLFTSCLKITKIDGGGDGPETKPASPVSTPETDESETLAPDPAPAENRIADFDLGLLREQNTVSSLLSRHDSVTVRREYDGGSEVESLWMRDGDLVYYSVEKGAYDDGEEYEDLYAYYRGYNIYPEADGETSCGWWISGIESPHGGEAEILITNFLPEEAAGDMLVLSEDEETVTVLVPEDLLTADGTVSPCMNTVTVNKGTLDIYSFHWEYEMGGEAYSGTFSVEYGGEQLGRELMEDWDRTRAVTVDILTEGGGRTENLEIPAAWELFLYSDDGIFLASPDSETEPDGSMVVEPGENTVSVLAFDEANRPTETVTEPEVLDELPFTMDELRENNRITNLLNQYGTLVLDSKTEYGEFTTSYFRRGDVIVRYSYMEVTGEDGTVLRQGAGNYGRDEFELNGDGTSYTYSAFVPDLNEADYVFYDTNAEGEHYAYDQTLTDALMLGSVSDIQSDGDTVSFRYKYDYDENGDSAMNWVVGREDALIRSVDFGDMSMTETMRPGADVPFQKELEDAFSKTRTVTCHFEGIGDYSYTLPADWSFVVGLFEELTCYSDAAMKEVREPSIQGDGKDYEIWVRVGGTVDVPAAPEPEPEPQPEPEPMPEPDPEPEPVSAEPEPLELFAGAWVSENGATELRIEGDGSFDLTMGGSGYAGTLEWTDKEAGLWASGGRYALILADGTPMTGEGYVIRDGDWLALCIGGGAEKMLRDGLIGVRKVEEGADLPAHDAFAADHGEYAADVLIEAYAKVTDFRVYALKSDGVLADGNPDFTMTELYRYASFTPEKALVLTMTFGEILPTYGFSYRDAAGNFHMYGIVESGMDGSAEITELHIPMG